MPKKKPCQVAVLGAGIMGSTTALLLAQKGIRSTLFDAAPEPMSRASRWNEGKIHLGFLYAADQSLETARRLIPGGLAFKPLVQRLLGVSLDPHTTPVDEVYLVHKDSVVGPDVTRHYLAAVAGLVREARDASRYLVDVSNCQVEVLSKREIQQIASGHQISAGFRAPERSVSTHWVADRYLEAIASEERIEKIFEKRVTRVWPSNGWVNGQWMVQTSQLTHGPFDYVVNALWEGKLSIDSMVDLPPQWEWSHRYRLSLFMRTSRSTEIPSIVLMTGPFGDIKNYNGRDLYLSWYPVGLRAESHAIQPLDCPEPNAMIRKQIKEAIVENLGSIIPSVRSSYEQRQSSELRGGWVFAMGDGSLADPGSTLHRRDRIGLQRRGTYISADTGKYSMAPWLAAKIAKLIPEST